MKPINKPDNIKIHFILGSGKAGTTLLLHILNNHKNCICSPETKHLLLFYKKYNDVEIVTSELIDDIKQYFGSMVNAKTAEDYEEHSEFGFKPGQKINYFELSQKLYYISAGYKHNKQELTTIIDKNPTYTLKTNELDKILPDANFLCMIRDYRSFVLSNIQKPESHAKKLPVQYHSLVWMFYNKLILDIKYKYKSRAQFLHYEDLVLDKEQALKDTCNFFNIEYDPSCFNYQDKLGLNDENIINNKKKLDRIIPLSKPINTGRLEAWKGAFTEFQLKIIEFWCGKTGEKLNYKKSIRYNWADSFIIILISLLYYIRVWAYFKLKPVRLTVYLKRHRNANL